jgi:hypothetical protein
MVRNQFNSAQQRKLDLLVKTNEYAINFQIYQETNPNLSNLALISGYRRQVLSERKLNYLTINHKYIQSTEVEKLHIIQDIVLDIVPINIVPLVDKVFENTRTLDVIERGLLSDNTINPVRLVKNILENILENIA